MMEGKVDADEHFAGLSLLVSLLGDAARMQKNASTNCSSAAFLSVSAYQPLHLLHPPPSNPI